MQATSNQHDHIRETIFRVAELVFGNPTDLDAGNCMLHPDTRPRQFTIVALLARR
jgi:hypothetical protein